MHCPNTVVLLGIHPSGALAPHDSWAPGGWEQWAWGAAVWLRAVSVDIPGGYTGNRAVAGVGQPGSLAVLSALDLVRSALQSPTLNRRDT